MIIIERFLAAWGFFWDQDKVTHPVSNHDSIITWGLSRIANWEFYVLYTIAVCDEWKREARLHISYI